MSLRDDCVKAATKAYGDTYNSLIRADQDERKALLDQHPSMGAMVAQASVDAVLAEVRAAVEAMDNGQPVVRKADVIRLLDEGGTQ